MIANADYLIDMGPGGGEEGGRIVAAGRPEEMMNHPESLTGRFLAEHLEKDRAVRHEMPVDKGV